MKGPKKSPTATVGEWAIQARATTRQLREARLPTSWSRPISPARRGTTLTHARLLRRGRHLACPFQSRRGRATGRSQLRSRPHNPELDRQRRLRGHATRDVPRLSEGDSRRRLGLPLRERRAGVHHGRHRLRPLRHGLLRRRHRGLPQAPAQSRASTSSAPACRSASSIRRPAISNWQTAICGPWGGSRSCAALRSLQPRLVPVGRPHRSGADREARRSASR